MFPLAPTGVFRFPPGDQRAPTALPLCSHWRPLRSSRLPWGSNVVPRCFQGALSGGPRSPQDSRLSPVAHKVHPRAPLQIPRFPPWDPGCPHGAPNVLTGAPPEILQFPAGIQGAPKLFPRAPSRIFHCQGGPSERIQVPSVPPRGSMMAPRPLPGILRSPPLGPHGGPTVIPWVPPEVLQLHGNAQCSHGAPAAVRWGLTGPP